MRPEHIFDELQTRIDREDALIVGDAGYCEAWGIDRLRFPRGGRNMIGPTAYGTLGYGLPAALGAKLAAPDRPVVCVTGDGGFGYALAELETAARCGIAVTVIVLDNGVLGWSLHYNRAFHDREGATAFAPTDFAAVARGLGCRGLNARTADEFSAALIAAMESDVTTVIDVAVHPDARPPVSMFD